MAKSGRGVTMLWTGPICLSKAPDIEMNMVVGKAEMEYDPGSLYWERRVLADAIEQWLQNFREVPCDAPCS